METKNLPSPIRPSSQFKAALLPAVTVLAGFAVLGILHWILLGSLMLGVGVISVFVQLALRLRESSKPEIQDERISELRKAFGKAQFDSFTEKQALRASEQLQQVRDRLKAFERTLSLKLNPTELTYGRYYSAAIQVQDGVFNQLNEVATRLAALLAMKPSEAESGSPLQARDEVRTRELKKVDELMNSNELAITKLDELTSAIMEMKSLSVIRSNDLAPMLAELEDLASRAKKYQ